VTAPVVTVDGPAGSGKTTLGRRLATALGLPFVDTGLFYRAVTLAAVGAGLRARDRARIVEVVRRTSIDINTDPEDRSWELRVDGADPGEGIRDPSHALLLSTISQMPEVRRHLLGLQRRPAANGAVAVGRDCGTVVFPGAQVKIFLTASLEERAARRHNQLKEKGVAATLAALSLEIAERDRRDISRSASPLVASADAVLVDTTGMPVNAVVERVLAIARDSIGGN